MDDKKPWWQSIDALTDILTSTVVLCLAALLVTATYLLIRWMV